MNRIRLLAAVTAIAALCGMTTASVASAQRSTITISGSTSVFPLAVKLAGAFKKTRVGRRVSFRVLQGGSDVGITDASRGRVAIGMSSRDPKSADAGKGVVFNKIARDAVCVVSNRGNPLPNLSQGQIQDIFSGRIRSWNRVPGARVSGTIDLIVRTPASGTQDAFQNIFMGQSLRVAGSATARASNGLQAQSIKSNPNAIGYASFNFTGGLHSIPYAGNRCTLRNAKSGVYGGARNFFFVTRGAARGATKAFIRYVRRSSRAKAITATNWVPLR